MDLKELEEFYLRRQSCRNFSDREVPDEVVTEICRAALLAPSAMNAQPWQLIAVKGEKREDVLKNIQHLGMNKFASKASAIVVVASDKSGGLMRAGEIFKKNEFIQNDLGILTAHLVLAAEAAGVGSCIIGWRDEAKLRECLGLGKNVCIPEVVALGYPEEGYAVREKKRKPFEETFTLLSDKDET